MIDIGFFMMFVCVFMCVECVGVYLYVCGFGLDDVFDVKKLF